MAGSAIEYLTLVLPAAHTLAVRAVHPVPRLIDMALAAQDVGIGKLKLFTF